MSIIFLLALPVLMYFLLIRPQQKRAKEQKELLSAVEEGDEVMSITQGGQVVRSRIDENFRVLGRSTMGVKFVTPKDGDAVAVVARSVEAKVEEELEAEAAEGGVLDDASEDASDTRETGTESENAEVDATIDGDDASE